MIHLCTFCQILDTEMDDLLSQSILKVSTIKLSGESLRLQHLMEQSLYTYVGHWTRGHLEREGQLAILLSII